MGKFEEQLSLSLLNDFGLKLPHGKHQDFLNFRAFRAGGLSWCPITASAVAFGTLEIVTVYLQYLQKTSVLMVE